MLKFSNKYYYIEEKYIKLNLILVLYIYIILLYKFFINYKKFLSIRI